MVLSLSQPAVQAMTDASAAVESAKRLNDEMAELVPCRFEAFAALPMQDPARGGRRAATSGQRAVGVPVYLHPRDPLITQGRIYDGYPALIGPAWGFGVETATHTLRLITKRTVRPRPGAGDHPRPSRRGLAVSAAACGAPLATRAGGSARSSRSVPVGALASKSRWITASSCSGLSNTAKSSEGKKFDGNTMQPELLRMNGFISLERTLHVRVERDAPLADGSCHDVQVVQVEAWRR